MTGVIGTTGGDGQCVWRWQVDEGYGSAHRKLVLVSAEMKSLSGAGVLVPTPPLLGVLFISFPKLPPCPTCEPPTAIPLALTTLFVCVLVLVPYRAPNSTICSCRASQQQEAYLHVPETRRAPRDTWHSTRVGRHCTVRTHAHITQSCSFLPSSSHSSSHPACICLSTRLDST